MKSRIALVMQKLHMASWVLATAFFTVTCLSWYFWNQSMESKRVEALRHIYNLLDIKIRAYQAHVDREFQHLDKTAEFIKYAVNRDIDSATLLDAVNSRIEKSEDRVHIFLTNQEGFVDRAHQNSQRPVTFKDHDFFRFHRDHASDLMKIGLLRHADTGLGDRIFLSKRVSKKNGDFAGVIVMTAPSSYFTQLFSENDFGHKGEVSVLHEDGRYLVSQLGKEVKLDVAADFSSIIRNIYLSRKNLQPVLSTIDGTPRYQALLHTGTYPFIIVGGIEEGEALVPYYQERAASRLNLALITLLLAILAVVSIYSLELVLKYRKDLMRSAQYDRLTGLYNRNSFQMLFEKLRAGCDKTGKKIALIFIDLDNFKVVNDTLGHEKGDALLSSIAKNLLQSFSKKDLICRLGGDEFVILATAYSTADIEQLGKKAVSVLNQPVKLGLHSLNVSGSIGISVYPDNGKDASTLLKNADIAMYESKAGGRNQMRFFDEPLSSKIMARAQMEEALSKAIKHNELFVLYQPVIDLCTMRAHAAEALVRWRHPARGILSPDEFIPIAEQTGLIADLTYFVMSESLREVIKWRQAGVADIRVGVNISALQFTDPHFASQVANLLASHGVSGELLELELTESVMIHNPDASAKTLEQLKALGVTVALDDFGTGYSSLSYLNKFAVDKIKIDKSFIRNLPEPEAEILINTIVALGRNLSLTVVAEGIETEEQHAFLRRADCHYGQGYLFSIPVESHALPAVLMQLAERSENNLL